MVTGNSTSYVAGEHHDVIIQTFTLELRAVDGPEKEKKEGDETEEEEKEK